MSADIVLTEDTLRYIALFEQITRANAIDCMDTEDKLVFVVEKGQGNIAVGKKGEHVIKLKEKTGKNIQVVEYSEDPEQFVKNVFHIYNPQKVVIEQRGNITHATVTVDPGHREQAPRDPEHQRRLRSETPYDPLVRSGTNPLGNPLQSRGPSGPFKCSVAASGTCGFSVRRQLSGVLSTSSPSAVGYCSDRKHLYFTDGAMSSSTHGATSILLERTS